MIVGRNRPDVLTPSQTGSELEIPAHDASSLRIAKA